MSTLEEKYSGVVSAAQSAGISNLKVQEQDGILYVSGDAANTAAKDTVWNALGAIDASYSASDINIDVQVTGLAAGASLSVATEESNLNIRQDPSTEAAVVGKASKGSSVTLVEQTSDDWWKVKTTDGVEGYAYARYLKA
ncbi:SH3 domain-containing protein [Chryseobacterium sp. Leaf394]|uniref:SH3 domain-containing protein n=1 Tax=Chryseobacterium sp. Leaf394 TaxID=1736361 RepID=UPI0006FF36C9|nr:SH3 domain-containing protein [Chryseobacterium sp. Leaf394]KQS93056.1 peptide-binding protein [Chryseobacterium sp. Leaf394]